jgi:MoaA/NifB/PqqE/SkfB family radical SAM enzyme
MQGLPKKLTEIYQKNQTEQNLYALAGAIVGVTEDKRIEGEKDIKKQPIGIGRLKAYFDRTTSATVYVGDTCNFKCIWCRRQYQPSQTMPDTDPKIVDTLLMKFPTINGVCICGFSEPLLSTTLFPIINIIKKHKKYIGIITNGSLLKQRLPELIANPPNYISISLNAHNAEEHEKCTQTKTWDTVIEGIKSCVNSPIECYVSSVVTTKNMKYIPELIKLVYSLGVKTLHLHNLLPGEDTLSDSNNFWKLVLQHKHQVILNEFKKIPESSIVKKWPTTIDKNGGFGTCEFLWKSIAVNGNGDVNICNSCLECKPENGNINDWVVWNNEYCQTFRDKYIQRSKELPCSMCFRNWKNF